VTIRGIADVQSRRAISEVCSRAGVSPLDLLNSPARDARMVRARHLAMYLVREVSGRSYPALGRMFSRHHTAVMRGCRKVAKLRESSQAVDAVVRSILQSLDTAHGADALARSALGSAALVQGISQRP
jgi:chromosomal replication initiator protein